MAGPRMVVNGPTFTPSPYGLWSAVQKPSASDPHWQNGITWIDRCPAADTLYEECIAVTGTGGSPTGQAPMAATFSQVTRGATSFAVYAEFDCGPVGLTDAERIANDALDRVEQYQVEKAFWTGVAGKTSSGGVAQTTVYPHLAANATLTATDGAILQTAATQIVTGGGDVAHQMGNLEAQLADCYHGQGVIHITAEALSTLTAWNIIDPDYGPAGELWTAKGNRVVVGDGYTGSSPSGVAAADQTSWIYATGAVFGYRSEVPVIRNLTEAFDRIENTYRLIAERVYVIGWECCHLATFVNLGVPT